MEQINRDIAALEATVRAIAMELENAYISYLTVLGQGVAKQLMLASYHVCTQGYPKQFVSLNLSHRQQLQQDIHKLAKLAAAQLLKHTQVEHPLEFSFLIEEETAPINFSNPTMLIKWQRQVEDAIAQTLKTLSSQTNSLLQASEILPNNLPLTPLLEAATSSSEDTPEIMTGMPNLLNLLIETDSESQESSVTQIIAIHLRLIDIEFADATIRAKRSQIRSISGTVGKLEREYQKKQRERDVAEAEAAWRASWFES